MGNNNGAFHYQNAHSNFTVRWPIKTEHSAFQAVVTRVTLPSFCDSRYICDSRYEVQDSMIWCKKTKGSFRVKSTNFQEMQHDPSQMFPKKLLKIPQCVLMTHTQF